MICAGAVEHDNCFEFSAVGIDEGAHAAKIAFAFFANVADEKNGALRLEVRELHSARQRQQGRQSAAIIGNSWGGHVAGIAVNFYVRARREHGVKVRRDNYNFFFILTAQFSDDVAGLVDVRGQAGFGQ